MRVLYTWKPGYKIEVECRLNYEPFQRGGSEYSGGPQIEPDEPEMMQLEEAYHMGVDIHEILSEDQIQEIEEQALESRNDK